MADHLDRPRLDALRAGFAPVGEPELHLDYDDHLEPFVDGTADALVRELVESHVEDCSACAGRLRELVALRAELHASAHVISRRRLAATPVGIAIAAGLVALAGTSAYVTWRATTVAPTTEATAQPDRPAPPVIPHPSTNASNGDTRPAWSADDAPDGTAPAVVLHDGDTTWSVGRDGVLGGTASAPLDAREAVVAALTRYEIETPSGLASLASPHEHLRGGLDDPDFEIAGPAGTYVREARPMLRWTPIDGANGYVVTLYDGAGNALLTSPRLDATRWTPPSDLTRGEVYAWQVAAAFGGREIVAPAGRPARFTVLADVADAKLATAERAAGRSHLLRGLAFARAGLVDDAERELRTLAAENPGNAIARRLTRALADAR